jgi:hypothetical protein
MTTRHIPGCYDAKFKDLVAYLTPRLPASLFYHNLQAVSRLPRLGSFEVSLKKFGSQKTQLLYSKLSKTKFPSESDLVAQITSTLVPDVVELSKPYSLDIQMYMP